MRSRPRDRVQVRWLVRAGFIAREITYGLIGALALALALGVGREPATPNQQGALALIAKAPLGWLALVLIAAGLLGYALWKLRRSAQHASTLPTTARSGK
jgi:heme/copper-type cytochrome/quinol oxidase subunit 2